MSIRVSGKYINLADVPVESLISFSQERFVDEMFSGNFNIGKSIKNCIDTAEEYGYVRGWNQAVEETQNSDEPTKSDEALELLRSLNWKSADKDNMEFQTTIPYNIMDKIRGCINS